ncbi:hypothetical protein PHET_02442 [Paragonimus heterotremus]|uniref:Uncharacterized protein n=1 Tax=Paragonimus heterotremus TaxID=100268 RepID=A0A8J4SQT4_9TREM|nr:hypothetical protein PHET_02442 [Paragonimus heterotremus]
MPQMNNEFGPIQVNLISQANALFNATVLNTTQETKEFFYYNANVFYEAMLQCLDLGDLMDKRLNNLTDTQLTKLTGLNNQSLYQQFTWCEKSRSTWFIPAFKVTYEKSWQKRLSFFLSTYVRPVLSVVNCINLLFTAWGLRLLLSTRQSTAHHYGGGFRSQTIRQTSATWVLLQWYAIFGLTWILFIDSAEVLFSYLPKYMNPKTYSPGCRIGEFLTSIFRYLPTWLMCVILIDRTLGEYRSHDRRLEQIASPRDINSPVATSSLQLNTTAGTVPAQSELHNYRSGKNTPRIQQTAGPKQMDCLDYISEFHEIESSHRMTSEFQCDGFPPVSWKPSVTLDEYDNEELYTDRTLNTKSGLPDVGSGKIVGKMLLYATVLGMCLLNTHILWLYTVKKDGSTCILIAGNSLVLGVIYPIILKVTQAILPTVLQLITLMILGHLARQRSRTARDMRDHFLTSQDEVIRRNPVFTPPTQLTILLTIVSMLFEIAGILDWLIIKLHPQPYPSIWNPPPEKVIKTFLNFTDEGNVIRSDPIHSYSRVRVLTTLTKIKNDLLIHLILRNLENQRFFFTLPVFLCYSKSFRSSLASVFCECYMPAYWSSFFGMRSKQRK